MPESNNETTNTTKAKARAFTSYTIDNILMRAELVTTGHNSDPDIQAAMLPFSYDSAAITALSQQLTDCRATIAATLQSRGEQKSRTEQLKADWDIAKNTTATFRTVCQELLKNEPGVLDGLGIRKGAAPRTIAAFLLYADTLFANALSASATVKAKLATRGYNDARLTSEKAKITALHTANQAQEQAKGKAQDLTPQQQKVLSDLDDEIMLYRKLARRALKGRPQLLEKLGIKA